MSVIQNRFGKLQGSSNFRYSNLDFKSHIKHTCGKAGLKLSTLSRISLDIDTDKEYNRFKMLLEKHQEFSIHLRNLQGLMTETYEIVNLIAPSIISSLFELSINIMNFQELTTDTRNTVDHGLKTVIYKVPPIRAKLTFAYKLTSSLDEFKSKIKSWECEMCSCRLCKQYQANLSYIRTSRITLPRYFCLQLMNRRQ